MNKTLQKLVFHICCLHHSSLNHWADTAPIQNTNDFHFAKSKSILSPYRTWVSHPQHLTQVIILFYLVHCFPLASRHHILGLPPVSLTAPQPLLLVPPHSNSTLRITLDQWVSTLIFSKILTNLQHNKINNENHIFANCAIFTKYPSNFSLKICVSYQGKAFLAVVKCSFWYEVMVMIDGNF